MTALKAGEQPGGERVSRVLRFSLAAADVLQRTCNLVAASHSPEQLASIPGYYGLGIKIIPVLRAL